MVNFLNNRNFFKIIFFFFILTLSFLLFRGRLGSDDLEVFNFIFNWNHYEGSFTEFKRDLYLNKKNFLDDTQLHSGYTLYHRLPWVIQTGIIYYTTQTLLLLFDIENYFLIQYFSGYILTFYLVISFFLFSKILNEKGLTKNQSIFVSILIFFGTGLICLTTGQYIESMAVFLSLLYIRSSKSFYKFIFALLITLIKPFYILVIFALKVDILDNKNFYFNKHNFFKLREIFIVIFVYFVCILAVTDVNNILNYFQTQSPTEIQAEYINNFFNFYFSFGAGVLFSNLIPILLIFYGFSKKTFLKILPIIILSFILSFWEGFHGCVPGVRYILPFLIIFYEEYIKAFKKIVNKKKFIVIIIFLLTILNLPTLEFRNFAISEYENATVRSFKPTGPAKLDSKNMNYIYYEWPVKSITFNHLFFSNYVLFSKMTNKETIKINGITIELKNIYPQTGLGRLIYIKRNNINIPYPKLKIFINRFYQFFVFVYIGLIFLFFIYFYKNLKYILDFHEKD